MPTGPCFDASANPGCGSQRLMLDDDALTAIIRDPAVALYAVTDRAGVEIGMLELDFRIAGECEIAFFGLVRELTGKGHGDWLMAQALALGWRKDVTRMWVHTCTLDHPGALGFYRRNGFTPFARAVETFADPRLIGVLPAGIRASDSPDRRVVELTEDACDQQVQDQRDQSADRAREQGEQGATEIRGTDGFRRYGQQHADRGI